MRAKHILCLLLLAASFLSVSQHVFGQATFNSARHETLSQTQILVTLNAPGVTWGAGPYSTVGWFVEINGANAPVTAISPFGSNILVTFDASGIAGHGGTQPFVKRGETLTVRYQGGGQFNAAALTPFGNQTSQNNVPFTCAELAYFQQGNFQTVDVCSPVVMNFQQYQYKVSLRFRNSSLFNLANFRTNIAWGDATNTNGIAFYISNLLGTADATFIDNTGFSGGNPGIVITQRPTKNYPAANPTDCSFNASITPLYDGVAFCNALATTSIFATYDTDNANSGNLAMPFNNPGTGETSDRVCLGNNVNMRFTDATQLNCRLAIEPIVPNDQARHIRIVYGSRDNGGVGNIPDVRITLPAVFQPTPPTPPLVPVQVTNNDATGTRAASYTPVNIGPADFNGVIAVAAPVNAATALTYMGRITTTQTNNQQVGQRFYIRMEYWDICNPYNPANPNNPAPVTIENYVEIIDSPNPPSVNNPVLCETAGDASFEITATATGSGALTYTWYADAALTTVLQGPAADNTFNPVTEGPAGQRINKTVTGSQTYTRYVTVTQGSNNCTSQPRTITIRIDDQNTAGVIAHPLGASPLTICSGTDPAAFTSTSPGTGGGPGGTFTYQWQSATNAAFSAGVTNIAGATLATYDPPAITSTLYFRRQLTSGSCNVANSNIIGFLVDTPVGGGTIAAAQTICANPGNPANLTSTTGATGGSNTGTYSYQWESSTDGVSFNTIAGATGVTYDPPAGLTQTTHYRRRVTSGVCVADGPDAGSDPDNLAYSNVIIVTVHQENNPGTIGNPQTICRSDDPAALTNVTPASGGDGTNYVYQWQSATNAAFTAGVTDIAGANALTFDPPALTATTFYRRRVRSPGPVTTTCSEAFTNVIAITVNQPPTAANPTGGGSVCSGNPAPDIQWNLTGSGPFQITYTITRNPGPGQTVSTVGPVAVTASPFVITAPNPAGAAGDVFHYKITVLQDNNSCSTSAASLNALTAGIVSIGGTAPAFATGGAPVLAVSEVCVGVPSTATTDPSMAFTLTNPETGNYTLTYRVDGGAIRTKTFTVNTGTGTVAAPLTFTDTPDIEFNGTTPSPHTLRIVSIQSPSGCLTNFTNTLDFTVRPLPTITTQPTDQEVCAGGSISYTVAANTTGGTTNFQWQVSTAGAAGPWNNLNNGTVGGVTTAGVTTTTLTLSGITQTMNTYRYRAVVTGVFPSTFSCPVNSADRLLTVRPYATINTAPTAQVTCAGTNASFTVAASVSSPSAITGYQWQISTTGLGGPYTDLTATAPYSGVTGATLTITNPTTALNGNYYRVNVTTTGSCAQPTTGVSFTVNPLPVSNAISPSVCEDIVHVLGSASVGTGQATNVDLTQFSAGIADIPGAPVEVPAGVEVWYYNSAADRNTNTARITTPVTITAGKQIFTRTRVIATGCFTDRTITFAVIQQPVPTNFTTQVCEDNPPGSQVASGINLTNYETNVTGGAANRDVEWYLDQSLTTLVPPGTLPNQERNFSISATTTLFAKIINTTTGCNSVAELKLEYQARPNANTIRDGAGVAIGSTLTVCASNNLVFLQIDPTLNPGSTYTWNVPTPPASPSDPGFFQILTPTNGFFIILRFPSLIPNPGVPISVTERLGTANCAGTTINTSVIVEGSPPAPVITGPSTVCENSPVTYSVPFVSGDTYSWSVPPGATITSFPITNTINVQMSTQSGNVTVTVANSTGCVAPPSQPLGVTVITRPSITSAPTNTLCSGQAPSSVHTLTASIGGTTYRWEIISISGFVNGANVGDTDGSVVGSNTPGVANIDARTLTNTSGVNAAVIYRVIPVSPPTAGVFCEGNQQNVTITIRPEPNLLLAPKTVCSDEPANYEIRLATVGLPTGTQFSWSVPVMSDGSTQGTSGTNVPAGSNGTIHITDAFVNTSAAAITATYTITAVSGGGCSSNQPVADRQVVITINPKPLISATLDKTVCSDEPIALTLTTGSGTVTASNYTIVNRAVAGALISHPGNATVPQASVAANYVANDRFTNTTGGPLVVTYTVNARGSIGTCQGPDQVITITINSGPSTNSVTDEVCSDVAGGNTHVENLVTLQPLVNPDGTLTFEWYSDAAATTAIGTPNSYPLQNGVPVYVKVHNGAGTCAKIQPVEYVVNPTPRVTASISSNYNGFSVRCIGSADGSITADPATLGTANYTYSVDGANFFTGRIFNGLAASNNPFTITVRDAKGCTATSSPMTLTEPPVMTAVNAVTSNYNGRQLSCPGEDDGQITVTAGGGTGSGYSYRIIETNATNTTGVFNGLQQGVYTVIVTDKAPNNCTITSNQVTITPPPVINASATLSDPASCNGASDGEITAIASGGTLIPPVPPNNYTFTITPGGTSNNTGVFTGLASSGTPYIVTVEDDNGCAVPSNGVVVTQPAAISAFISVNTGLYPGGSAISCFGANDAQLNVTANGGNGGYAFVLNVVTPGAANTTGNVSGTYSGVNPGEYTATVTDSRGCNVTSGRVTVAQPADITIQQFVTNPISCNGEDDGQIRLVATGGTGAFTYTRTAGAPVATVPEANGTGIFSDLSAFNYPFTVNDINGCSKNVNITLTEPAVVQLSGSVISNYNGAQIKCPTSADGIVQLSVTGGNGNFAYTITNPVLAPPNVTGATSGIFNGLAAGTFTFRAVDPKGCNASQSVTITPPTAVTIDAPAKRSYSGQDVSCTNFTDGEIRTLARNGTTPPAYTYVLSPSSNTSGASSGIFTGVGPGTYTITGFDANGCSATSSSIMINPYAAITFNGAAVVQYNGREITCFGASDGQINSTPTGGAGAWSNFTISPAPGTLVNAGNGTFTGLPAGSYVISAQDANLCPASTATILVRQPDVLVASASVVSAPTCFNLDNASVRASAVGGTVTYDFSINTTPVRTDNDVPSPHVFSGLPANPGYIVTVTDVNGCTDDVTVDPIVAPSQPQIAAQVTSRNIPAYNNQDITCFGANDAIITATHTSGTGTGSLTYTLAGPGSNTTGQFTGVFSLLGPGGFTVSATDVNGCASNAVPVPVTEPPQLQATLSSGSNFGGFDIKCFNEQNGAIIVTSSGGTGNRFSSDFQYVLIQSPSSTATITPPTPGPGEVRFTNLRAMQYQARVRDLNGCTIITSPPFELFQPAQINLSAAVTSNYGADGTDISCVGANDGVISVNAAIAGGVGLTGGGAGSGINDYTYTINPAANTSGAANGIFTGLGPNTLFTIRATDANGCTADAFPVMMFEPGPLFAGFVGASQEICINQANKTTQPFTELQGAFGGNGSYEYRWMQSTAANPVWPADYTPAGATTPVFTAPTNLAVTTHYIREVRTTTATSATSCPTLASNQLTITVNARPTVTIADPGTICQGTPFGLTFNFTGAAPITFDYDMLQTGSANPPTPQNNQIASNTRTVFINNYQEETTFTVTRAVDRNGCEALPITSVPREFMAQRTVPIVKVLADLQVTSPNPQCSGETFTFAYAVDPNVTYTFTWPDGAVETITPAMATGTISRQIVSLNTGSSTQFPIILKAAHTSCQPLTAIELVDVYPAIITNVVASAERVCSGTPILVTNNTLGGQDHKWTVTRITGAGAPDQVSSDPSTTTATNKTFTITNTTAQNPAEYEVVYTATNSAANGSCQADTTFNVFVYREAVAAINRPTVGLWPGGSYPLTFGNATNPYATNDFSYTWNFSNNNPNTPPVTINGNDNEAGGVKDPTYTFMNPGTGKRAILTVINRQALADNVGSGCPTRDEFIFTINVPPLNANFTSSGPACLLSAGSTITVNNLSTGGNLAGTDFVSEWEVRDHTGGVVYRSNLRNPTFPMTMAGRYSIYLTVRNPDDATAPSSFGPLVVDIYPNPQAAFITSPLNMVFIPDQILRTDNRSSSPQDPLTLTPYPIYYEWDFGDGSPIIVSDVNPVANDPNSGHSPTHQYTVENPNLVIKLVAINDHGGGIMCTSTATQAMQARAAGTSKIPNAFTPGLGGPTGGIVNEDGTTINDVFLPITKGVKEFQMQIFDRWGNLIFESQQQNRGWDGYDRNGNLMPAGVYVYKLVLRMANDQRTTQVGDVTLIR